MDEQALGGFLAALWALARLIGASVVLISGLAFLFRALIQRPEGGAGAGDTAAFGDRDGMERPRGSARLGARPAAEVGPALPRRPGLARLSSECAGAITRGYYRSLVAERLRALGRDALAMNEDLSDEEAYRRLRAGTSFLSDDDADLLLGDHFAARPGREGRGLHWSWLKLGSTWLPKPSSRSPEQDQSRDSSYLAPFLTRVDAYLNTLRSYMQGSGGNDGRHKR